MDELIFKSEAVKEIVRHFHVSEVDAKWILSELKTVKRCEDCPKKGEEHESED